MLTIFFLINIITLLILDCWFYNFKNFKFNGLASPFRRKKRKLLATLKTLIRVFDLVISMVQSSACYNFPQNSFFGGKNKLINTLMIEAINIFAESHILTYNFVCTTIVFVFACFFIARYFKDNL